MFSPPLTAVNYDLKAFLSHVDTSNLKGRMPKEFQEREAKSASILARRETNNWPNRKGKAGATNNGEVGMSALRL